MNSMLMTRDRPCKARKVKCGEEKPQCVKYNSLACFFILSETPRHVAQR
jgi:hypothetical protein